MIYSGEIFNRVILLRFVMIFQKIGNQLFSWDKFSSSQEAETEISIRLHDWRLYKGSYFRFNRKPPSLNSNKRFLNIHIQLVMNFESSFYHWSCPISTLSINRKSIFADGSLAFRFNLTIDLSHEPSYFHMEKKTGDIHLSSRALSASGECILVPRDRLVTFIWPMRQAGASHFAWICSGLHKARVCFSALLPKQSLALTQVISGWLVRSRGRGITWEMLPFYHPDPSGDVIWCRHFKPWLVVMPCSD